MTRRGLMLAPLLLSACGRRDGARPLFASDTHPEGYPTVEAVHAIDRLLDERTNGEMRIRVYAGSQLGAERDTIEITIFGGLDLIRVNLGPLNSIVPESMAMVLPFVFRSIEHSRRVFDSDAGRSVLDAMTPHGLKGICYYDSGARSVYNTQRPVRTPDDMQGLKIRVQNSDIYVAMMQALGANATPVPYPEVYQALVQGVVDGAENNWPSYEQSRHFEVARHYSLTRHVMGPEVLAVSTRSWEKMSNEERDYLSEAAIDSVPIMREIWDERVNGARERLLADGVNLVEDVDTEAFASLMGPVWERFVTTPAMEDLVNSIQAMGEADG